MMLQHMQNGCPSICPKHARAMHVRTYVRTQLTNASKTQDHHLLFSNVRAALGITLIASQGVTA
jgi:hypothetical protein